MNLDDHEFIPFRTKVKLSDNTTAVFTAKFEKYDSMRYRFVVDNQGESAIFKTFKADGSPVYAHNARVVSVGKVWKPMAGDIVRVHGFMENLHGTSGRLHGAERGLGMTRYVVVEPRDGDGYVYINNANDSTLKFRTHARNLQRDA